MNSEDPNEGSSSSQNSLSHVKNVPTQISSDAGSPDDSDFDTTEFLLDQPADEFDTNNSLQEEIPPDQTCSANVGMISNINLFPEKHNRSLSDIVDGWKNSRGRSSGFNLSAGGNAKAFEGHAQTSNFQQDLVNPFEESSCPHISSPVQNFWPAQLLPSQTFSGNVGTSNINVPPQNLLKNPSRYVGSNNQTHSDILDGWIDSRGRSTRFKGGSAGGENSYTLEGNVQTSSEQQNLAVPFGYQQKASIENAPAYAGNNNQKLSGWMNSRCGTISFTNPSAGENCNTSEGMNASAVEIGRNEAPAVVPPTVINRSRKSREKLPALAQGLTWLNLKMRNDGRKKKEINLGPAGDHFESSKKGLEYREMNKSGKSRGRGRPRKNPGETSGKGKGNSDLQQRSSQNYQNFHVNPELELMCDKEYQRVLRYLASAIGNQLPTQGTGENMATSISTNLPSNSVNSVAAAETPVAIDIEGSNNSTVASAETQAVVTGADDASWVEDLTDNASPRRPQDIDHDFEKWKEQQIHDFDSAMGSDSADQDS